VKESGVWVGGVFAKDSYAAGFPNEPDLYIEEACVLYDDGEFQTDEGGLPDPVGTSLLIRFAEVDYIEFIEGGDNG
jgi:hypothetical protein